MQRDTLPAGNRVILFAGGRGVGWDEYRDHADQYIYGSTAALVVPQVRASAHPLRISISMLAVWEYEIKNRKTGLYLSPLWSIIRLALPTVRGISPGASSSILALRVRTDCSSSDTFFARAFSS